MQISIIYSSENGHNQGMAEACNVSVSQEWR